MRASRFSFARRSDSVRRLAVMSMHDPTNPAKDPSGRMRGVPAFSSHKVSPSARWKRTSISKYACLPYATLARRIIFLRSSGWMCSCHRSSSISSSRTPRSCSPGRLTKVHLPPVSAIQMSMGAQSAIVRKRISLSRIASSARRWSVMSFVTTRMPYWPPGSITRVSRSSMWRSDPSR